MKEYNYRKIFVLSDLHFGVRNNALAWIDMMNAFYRWFIDDVEKQGFDAERDALFILGDVFHSRESINLMTLNNVCKVFSTIREKFTNVHILTGNHDTYYIDNNSITTVKLLSDLVKGIECWYEPEQIAINGNKVLMLPWITSFNAIHDFIDKDDSDYLFCHMDINGMKYSSGINIDKCVDTNRIKKYKKVFSGHIHTRQDKGNVLYVGAPYQLDSSDFNNDRGYYIIDTKDFSYTFVQNNISPKYISVEFDYIMNLPANKAKEILDNNYVDMFCSRKVYENADLILLKQKLNELGIDFKSMSFTMINSGSNIEEDMATASFDFNIHDACIKMLKDAKKSDSEIEDTMEYFNMIYTLTKTDAYNGIQGS